MKHTFSSKDLAQAEEPSVHGNTPVKAVRRWGLLKWIIPLLTLCGLVCIAYKPVMGWLGKADASAAATSSSTADCGKNANDAKAKATGEQIKSYLAPSDAETGTTLSPPASINRANLNFRERMGPVAGWLNDVLEQAGERVICPTSEWIVSLNGTQRILFWVLLGAIVIVPVVIVVCVVRRKEISLSISKGAVECAALAGVVFTIWGGFEIGGSVGEWLVIAVMALIGLSTVLAVIGGLLSGESIVIKVFAPFMLLEMSLVVFILAVIGTIVFIVVAMVIIILSMTFAMADYNTVYECPNCGRLFHGKPSSCPCGAQFS